jgi:transcriptional regulator with XRE-family HTH domain
LKRGKKGKDREMHEDTLQQLKMAWLAAEEAGDKEQQIALLRDHPTMQDALIDFIAAYRAVEPEDEDTQNTAILMVTQRGFTIALERIFQPSTVEGGLRQLREQRGLSLGETARGLKLGIDVWKKFEDGVIELVSLSERQLERLAAFFHVGIEQFGTMLNNSLPMPTLDRRQTAQAARSTFNRQNKQSFAEAVKKSSMSKEQKKDWLD